MQCNWPQRCLLTSGSSLSSSCKMCTRSAQEALSSLSMSSEARPSTVPTSGYACQDRCEALPPGRSSAPLHPSLYFPGVQDSPNLQREVGEQPFEPVLDDQKTQELGLM